MLIDGFVQRALAPYEALLSPEDLAEFEQALRVSLASHPSLAAAMDRIRKGGAAPAVPASSDVLPQRPRPAVEAGEVRLAARSAKRKPRRTP